MNYSGTLNYNPLLLGGRFEKWWAILDCSSVLGAYYRHLYFLSRHKTESLARPAWDDHITLIRNEEPPRKELWEVHAGKTFNFQYSPIPQTNGHYWWLNIECEELLNIREALGLPRQPLIPLHLSFGHL